MSSTIYHNAKNNASKWLFAVILFLSVFAFSGLPVNSSVNPYQQQTSLLANKPNRLTNHIRFNRTIKQAREKPATSQFIASSFCYLVNVYNVQVSVCLKSCNIILNRPTKGFFYRVKTNSPTDDNPTVSLV
jgi:hypothetical protein